MDAWASDSLRILRAAGVELQPGLTDSELARAEEAYDVAFAPEHRALLQAALPTGDRWPNWRRVRDEATLAQLAWPEEGLWFDVEHNAFWPTPWGPRPEDPDARRRLVREQMARVPRLVPIVGHRYLPPATVPDRPVLSVYQTDVIYYGGDLPSFIAYEFGGEPARPVDGRVPFWSDVVDCVWELTRPRGRISP